MKIYNRNVLFTLFNFAITFITSTVIKEQPPKTNELPKTRRDASNDTATVNISSITVAKGADLNATNVNIRRKLILQVKTDTRPSLITSMYITVLDYIKQLLSAPKVSSVMRNIATCVVNGGVELISYYFPPPLIPIIASAAGMLIPFEPVRMLREKLPVTSYRRAFMTALNTFLGTFDKYKLNDNDEYDPYMTQRFNRRMMNYGSSEKSTQTPCTAGVPATSPGGRKGFMSAVNNFLDSITKLDHEDNNDYDTKQLQAWRLRNSG